MASVTSADGTRIVYDKVGAGPPVVVLTSGLGDRSIDLPLVEVLSPFLTVFTYDRRGRGESGDTQPYSPQREYEDLAAVIAEAGGSAGVYGSSGMAMFGLEAAAYGVPISKLAMWEPPYIVDESRSAIAPDWGDHVAELVAQGRHDDAIHFWLTRIVEVPEEYVLPMHGTPFWTGMAQNAPGLVHDARILGDFSLPAERAAAVSAPVLLMDGGDAALPWIRHGVQAALGVLPDGRYQVLDGQQHDVQPAEIAPVLIKFFEE